MRPEHGLRVVLEDVLCQTSRVDAVAQDADGQIVVILIATCRDEESLLTRALAARAWLGARIGDWSRLVPELKLRHGAHVRALILAPRLSDETRSAAASLPVGFVETLTFRSVRLGNEYDVVLDEREQSAAPVAVDPSARAIPRFRSGLTDSDLGLSDEEREQFESTS